MYAWLCVPGTNVRVPVCQHPDDGSYYYSHGPDGRESAIGSAYTERPSARDLSDPVTVIYGHSFSDADLVFTRLHRFEDASFSEEHDGFHIHLPGKTLSFRVVSCRTFNDANVTGLCDFSDESVLRSYFDFVSAATAFEGELDAGADRIVQLSTCTLPLAGEMRFVVTGVLVGEEEA